MSLARSEDGGACVVSLSRGGGNIIFDVARRRDRTKSQTSIIAIAQKKGGPRRRPTKLEAAAINRNLKINYLYT